MTAVALAKAYPSIWERPVIEAVDPRVFSLTYFRRCMACGFCADQCCTHGVDIDLDNARRLLAIGAAFETFVGVPKERWFTSDPVADPEFPSGSHLRTRVNGSHCVFHDGGGRGCKIHAWCLRENLDHRALKPLVSLLFPLTFEHGVLEPSTEILDGTLVCGGAGDTLYAGAREELSYFFGSQLVGELDQIAGTMSPAAR